MPAPGQREICRAKRDNTRKSSAADSDLTLFAFGRKISYICITERAVRAGCPLFMGCRRAVRRLFRAVSHKNASNGSAKCTTWKLKCTTCIFLYITSPQQCTTCILHRAAFRTLSKVKYVKVGGASCTLSGVAKCFNYLNIANYYKMISSHLTDVLYLP